MAIVAQLIAAWDGSSRAQLASAWAEEAAPPIVIPTIAATNAHVVSLSTGQVYYSKGTLANEDRPASLTKLMTVLVLLDYKPTLAALSQTVTIQASDQVGGSGNNLLNGDVITLHALMMNALLPSSNSAATAIARTIGQELLNAETGGVGDPVARFVMAMNAKAASLGCADTTFFDASGLSGNNTSTPADLNVIAGALWQSGVARAAWSYQTYPMPLVRSGTETTVTITSSNAMFSDSGIVGGKTGTLTSIPPATYNLNVLWRANTRDVVSFSIFGSTSDAQRYTDMRALVAALKVDYPEVLGAAVAPAGTLTLGTPSVTSSSISLPWTYSAADHDGIEYRYRLTAGTWSAWIDAGLVSPIEITGLTSSAEYEIEARAYNPAGTSTPQTVTVTVGAAGSYTLSASGGAFSFTGGNAAFVMSGNQSLIADAATFQYSGGEASFEIGALASGGEYSYAGGDAMFALEIGSAVISADPGSFPYFGGEVAFFRTTYGWTTLPRSSGEWAQQSRASKIRTVQ